MARHSLPSHLCHHWLLNELTSGLETPPSLWWRRVPSCSSRRPRRSASPSLRSSDPPTWRPQTSATPGWSDDSSFWATQIELCISEHIQTQMSNHCSSINTSCYYIFNSRFKTSSQWHLYNVQSDILFHVFFEPYICWVSLSSSSCCSRWLMTWASTPWQQDLHILEGHKRAVLPHFSLHLTKDRIQSLPLVYPQLTWSEVRLRCCCLLSWWSSGWNFY